MFGPMPLDRASCACTAIPRAACRAPATTRWSTRSPTTSSTTPWRSPAPGSGSPLLIFELRQLGGALSRVPDGAGALGKIDGRYLAFAAGMVTDPDAGARIEAAGRDAMAALAPYSRGRKYLNFSERVTNTRSAYSVETHQRLQAIKARYDAGGLVHGNHRIEAAAS